MGRSSPNLVGRLRVAPDISSRGLFFKGHGHRGQRSNFCISAVLGPICMKLGECIQVDPYISSRGSFFKGQGHRGQRSNFCISAVLGPICMKLGQCIQVNP